MKLNQKISKVFRIQVQGTGASSFTCGENRIWRGTRVYEYQSNSDKQMSKTERD